MEDITNYLTTHLIEIIGLLIAYFGLVVPIFQYLNQRKLEEKDKRFTNFHRLIKDLVEPGETGNIMLDRQIAVIYEFRNYPEYYSLMERILTDLKKQWTSQEPRIILEIELTLEYIDYKRTNFISKLFKHKP